MLCLLPYGELFDLQNQIIYIKQKGMGFLKGESKRKILQHIPLSKKAIEMAQKTRF
jgi:hypothetical protein